MPNNDFASIWDSARIQYAQASGKDFKDMPIPKTTDELLNSISKQNGDYKHFREKSVRRRHYDSLWEARQGL